MAAPLAPMGLVPWGGQTIIVNRDNAFTWRSDGTQSAFYIEYGETATGATINNSGWQTSSVAEYSFIAGTLTNTKVYKWRVKVRNASGQESLFSDWAVFVGGNTIPLTITFPATEYAQVETLPVYQHAFTPSDGSTQYSYRYQVYIGATWDDWDGLTAEQQDTLASDEIELYECTAIWDSGDVASAVASVEQPSGYFVPSQYWYKVRVTIVDSAGNTHVSDLRTFYILLDSVPKAPTITVTSDPSNGQNIINITNPTPDPGQVSTSYNRVYRRKLDGTWELIADNIADGVGYDRSCRSGVAEEYTATAVGTNGIEGGKATSVIGTCTLTDYWFTNLTTNETVKLRIDARWGRMQSEREREEQCGMDERYPGVFYGSKRHYRGNFSGALLKPTGGTTWRDYLATVRDVLDTASEVLLRTMFGDTYRVKITSFNITPKDRLDQHREISIGMIEVAEAVPAGSFAYDTPDNNSPGFWIINAESGNGIRIYVDPQWSGITSDRDRFETVGLNSEMPDIEFGKKQAYRGGFSGYLLPPEDGSGLANEIIKLRELVDAKNKKPVVFRSKSGDRFLVDTYGFSFELFDRFNNARKIAFEFIEIGGI